MVTFVPGVVFQEAGYTLINNGRNSGRTNRPFSMSERTFKAHFRLNPTGCSDLYWNMAVTIEPSAEENEVKLASVRPSHLLWTLNYLFTYCSNEVGATFCGVSKGNGENRCGLSFSF